LESQYILKNNETFSNLSTVILSQKYQKKSMQVENRETLAARGLEELFSSCAVVSVFGSGGK
jgi:hypothetical protein